MTENMFKTVNLQYTSTVTLKNPYSQVPDRSLAGRFVLHIMHETRIQGIRLLFQFGIYGLRVIAASIQIQSKTSAK